MVKYKNLIKNDEFLKTLFIKSIFRKIGFIGGFSYGINQKTKINNIEVSGIGSGLIYGGIWLSIIGSMPLWILTNIYFFHNYRALVYPDTKFIKYKSKCDDNITKNVSNNDSNKNDPIFYDLPIL
jgi:hypothetical protein